MRTFQFDVRCRAISQFCERKEEAKEIGMKIIVDVFLVFCIINTINQATLCSHSPLLSMGKFVVFFVQYETE